MASSSAIASRAARAAVAGDKESTPRTGEDVVFTFSYLHWDGAHQRGMNFAQDRLVQTLLSDDRVDGLIVANWWRNLPRHAARSIMSPSGRSFPGTARKRLHQPLRLRRSDPVSLRGMEKAYRAYDRSLRRAARSAGLDRPAVITMHVLVAGFAPLEWAGPVTFYATDDWTAAYEYNEYLPMFEEGFRRVRERGHRVCAVSQPIIDRLRPTGPAVAVPNGVDPAQWDEVGPAPDWFLALPRPRVLYVGTLDRRIDLNLVRQSAAAVLDGSVTLVGKSTDAQRFAAFAELRARPNVHVHDRVPHSEVPALVSAADACLLPHVRTQLTEAMSPLKVYEYLAAGRPVVAADLPPVRGLGPRVLLVPEGGDFGAALRDALAMGPAAEADRQEFLTRNSWRARHETVLDFALRDVT